MPEYPDITIYREHLEKLITDKALEKIRLGSPFFLRTAEPPLTAIEGLTVKDINRIGKRITLSFENNFHLVIHLMIAGRLYWKKKGVSLPAKRGLAAFDFENGTLLIMEHTTQKRASLHLVQGKDSLQSLDPGGLELFSITPEQFRERLLSENHTLKRALTDPRLFSGIGNTYSDEILHKAKLSPVKLSQKLTPEETGILFDAAREVLTQWTNILREKAGDSFPEKVTAFHEQMAVHGKFGKPCPECGTPVQRIRYATNETNYCPECQTEGKVLADRALSRLLKKDWPRTVDELERKGLIK